MALDGAPGKKGLPASIEFDRILDTAEQLRNEFHHSKIEPLHILAAALREPREASRLLKEAGITKDRVMGALERPGAAEQPGY
jgi:ATP-dependent Clp protease ATP-binding subunit ClpA